VRLRPALFRPAPRPGTGPGPTSLPLSPLEASRGALLRNLPLLTLEAKDRPDEGGSCIGSADPSFFQPDHAEPASDLTVSPLLDRNIALIGFMTAGKTRVGQALGIMTGVPFVDIDALIEELEGMPVHRIFQIRGEPYFRQVETTVLRDLCLGSGRIIGCGGGSVLVEENRRLLKERCVSVWLRVSELEVRARLEDPQSPRRPLLEGLDPDAVISRLLPARELLYAQADFVVVTDGRTVEEIAREVARLMRLPTFGS
jgi:shikimate kinase